MPKLTILAACENVIIDRRLLPSLINIFQRMNVPVEEAPLPEKAISPIRWSIFAMWQHVTEEIGVQYTQRTEVYFPSGEVFASTKTDFSITEASDLQSKNQTDMFGLPIQHEGYLKIRVWLEGHEDEALCNGEYLVAITHVRKETPIENPVVVN